MNTPKLSKHAKLNHVLTNIWDDLDRLGIDEVRHYMREFPNEPDYNIARHGNCLIWYDDVTRLFTEAGYENPKQFKGQKGWNIYLCLVGRVANDYVHEHVMRGL